MKLKDNVPLKKVLCSALYGLDYLICACPAIHTNDCKIKTISCYKIINENSFYSYNTFFGIILPGNDIGQLFNNVSRIKCLRVQLIFTKIYLRLIQGRRAIGYTEETNSPQ